ncbi:MAG: hypothetical protein PHS14_16740 [Elusimicrobia bacterium]|nr:hypothetical protein [Elusimicrobiota bacterium]
MDAPPVEHRVLVCVPCDEREAAVVMAEAARLAGALNAPLSVIHLYPAAWNGPLRAHPSAWHLKTDEPAEAVGRFAARHRFTHIVFNRSQSPL